MLILERRVEENVVIELPDGRLVTLKVVKIDRERGLVRLGLVADRDVLILRSELLDENPPTTGG